MSDLVMSKFDLLYNDCLGDIKALLDRAESLSLIISGSTGELATSINLQSRNLLESAEGLRTTYALLESNAKQSIDSIVKDAIKDASDAIRTASIAAAQATIYASIGEAMRRYNNSLEASMAKYELQAKTVQEKIQIASDQVSWTWRKRIIAAIIALTLSVGTSFFMFRGLALVFPTYSESDKRLIAYGRLLVEAWDGLDEATRRKISKNQE